MSPHLHYQIARAHQQEIVNSALSTHHSPPIDRRRSVGYRLVQLVSVLGVCVAAGTAVTVSEAHSTPLPVKQHEHAVHVSPRQLAGEIRTFEAKGYVPAACTVSGTLLRNYTTGQSVTVEW